jgi:hypothetical protein
MRYAWMHGMQTQEGTAKMVWNLATISTNLMLAALVQTEPVGVADTDTESLLLVLEKSSGAPLFPAYKMWHDSASFITTMNPTRRDLMKWTDATSLWIVLTNDGSNL